MARPTTGLRRIVWLASWPRSGNSWLRTLLANFLADADARRLRRAAAFSAFARLRRREECHGYGDLDPRSPHPFFRSGKADDWRRHLSAAQIREIVETHGETAVAFDYGPQETLREIAGPSRQDGGGNHGDRGESWR